MAHIDHRRLLLLVVGIQLRCELSDRPVAESLRRNIQKLLDDDPDPDEPIALSPLICTDVWYTNNVELHDQPVISVGGPGSNALSANLYPRLPTALSIEQRLMIQLDVEMTDLRACVWGVDHGATAAAVELFEKKYLPHFVRAANLKVSARD